MPKTTEIKLIGEKNELERTVKHYQRFKEKNNTSQILRFAELAELRVLTMLGYMTEGNPKDYEEPYPTWLTVQENREFMDNLMEIDGLITEETKNKYEKFKATIEATNPLHQKNMPPSFDEIKNIALETAENLNTLLTTQFNKLKIDLLKQAVKNGLDGISLDEINRVNIQQELLTMIINHTNQYKNEVHNFKGADYIVDFEKKTRNFSNQIDDFLKHMDDTCYIQPSIVKKALHQIKKLFAKIINILPKISIKVDPLTPKLDASTKKKVMSFANDVSKQKANLEQTMQNLTNKPEKPTM